MCNSSCYNQKFQFTHTAMAQFDLVAAWEVDGLVDLLADCGIIEGHPWFEKVSKVVTHFCGTTAGVDSVTEMAMKRIKGVPIRTILLKHLNDEFPDFPKIKCDKLRKALVEICKQHGPPSASSCERTKSSKRGRKSKFTNDVSITWKTVDNPHTHGSIRWAMWEIAYEAETRGDFLSYRPVPIEGLPGDEPVFETFMCLLRYLAANNGIKDWKSAEACAFVMPNSTYFNLLVSMGHIEVKVE